MAEDRNLTTSDREHVPNLLAAVWRGNAHQGHRMMIPQAAAVARQYFGLYSAGQFALSWTLLAPSAQRAVSQATCVAVHQGCPSQSAGLAYNIKDTTLTASMAIVAVTLADTAASLASESLTYSQAGGDSSPATSATTDMAASKPTSLRRRPRATVPAARALDKTMPRRFTAQAGHRTRWHTYP